MNRKNNTIKQLQAECKKRNIGFMMNWTKIALIKRLEDEDKRELANKKIEDKASKEITKAKKELKLTKLARITTEKQLNAELRVSIEELKKTDPKEIEKGVILKMVATQEWDLKKKRKKLDLIKSEQNTLIEKSNKLAKEGSKIAQEIKALELSVATLK